MRDVESLEIHVADGTKQTFKSGSARRTETFESRKAPDRHYPSDGKLAITSWSPSAVAKVLPRAEEALSLPRRLALHDKDRGLCCGMMFKECDHMLLLKSLRLSD